MNSKFPVLSIVSILIRIIGWLSVLAGLYYCVYQGIIEPNQEGHTFGSQDQIELLSGLVGAFGGLITVAIGEAIGVLFAIEKNTRKTAVVEASK